MADWPSSSRATRRQVLAGGAAFLSGGTGRGGSADNASLITDAANGAPPTGDAAILELERQAHAASTEWLHAADAFAKAEEACWALLKDPEADDAAKDDATARQLLANDEANRLAEAVDELALKLCSIPADSLAGLVCKARVTLWLEMDGLAELVLRDLVRLAGDDHG